MMIYWIGGSNKFIKYLTFTIDRSQKLKLARQDNIEKNGKTQEVRKPNPPSTIT
jgi:hypothetical protein